MNYIIYVCKLSALFRECQAGRSQMHHTKGSLVLVLGEHEKPKELKLRDGNYK